MWISSWGKLYFRGRPRICTVLSELSFVEMHKNMCKSAQAEICFPTCENSHKMVHFHMRKYTKNCEFPNVRKYSFFCVFPHAEIQVGKSKFPHVNLQSDSWISAGKNIREYTFFCGFPHVETYTRIREFPRAEIHAERCITACGNTLNQVQKIVPKGGGWKPASSLRDDNVKDLRSHLNKVINTSIMQTLGIKNTITELMVKKQNKTKQNKNKNYVI